MLNENLVVTCNKEARRAMLLHVMGINDFWFSVLTKELKGHASKLRLEVL